MNRVRRRALLLVAPALVGSASIAAQSIAARIGAVRAGTVWMTYASAPGVCGNGRGNISVRGDRSLGYHEGGDRAAREWEDACEAGPVRVSLDLDQGRIVSLRTYVGGRWRGAPTLDLGTVPPAEATDFLLGIAERGEGRPAKDAIFPASIAEGAVIWPRLLKLAKDTARPRDVRESAVFWVSQAAGEAATSGLQAMVDDPVGDREVRKSAVFAISQRPKDESVPALLRIARTHKDPELRRNAIFWLGQSKDPRAISYFEEVLLKGR